jgi:hypothetical protein
MKILLSKFHKCRISHNGAICAVHFKAVNFKVFSFGLHGICAARERLNACQQFRSAYRLSQIIMRAFLQRLYRIVLTIA